MLLRKILLSCNLKPAISSAKSRSAIMRAMLKRPMVRLAVLGVALIGSAATWYLIAPLFTGAQSHSIFPTLALMPSPTPRPPTATPLPSDTPEATSTSAVSFIISADVQLVAAGEFYPVTHAGSGTASIYMLEDGGLVLSLEDFEVEDGPDLRLFVSDQEPIAEEGFTPEQAIDLGLLEAYSGDQVYQLPDDLNVSEYQSVLVWCDSYQEPFIAASLETAAAE